LPASATIVSANSFARRWISAAAALRILPRSCGGTLRVVANAFSAATTAASSVDSSPIGTRAIVSPVYGLITGSARAAATHSPLMKSFGFDRSKDTRDYLNG
jgi:hypothetical protein